MTFPISRQGLEQIAIALAVGAVLFAALAILRWRRDQPWRRSAISAGRLGGLPAGRPPPPLTGAPTNPTPPRPLTPRCPPDPPPATPRTAPPGDAARPHNPSPRSP